MTQSTTNKTGFEGDNPVLGISLMAFFCMFIPFGDALMKLLGNSVPLMTLLLVRFIMQIAMMGTLMLIQRGGIAHLFRMSRYVFVRLVVRAIVQIAGIGSVFIGLKYLPVADNTAICFVYPLLMLIIGHLVMKEQVGPHRIFAAIVGFVGTLLVVQPNFMAVGANAFWPLLVAVTFVVVMMVTRQVSREIDPVSIQVMTGLFATVILALLFALFGRSDYAFFDMAWPKNEDWWLLIAAGVVGSLGHLTLAFAVRYAPSSSLAPMQYLEIPFATLIGWMIFGDLPNTLAAWGIAITVASGLYIVERERKAHKRNRKVSASELTADEPV
nr:DMT family transporter [uncultured Cohaesibacter sp.]